MTAKKSSGSKTKLAKAAAAEAAPTGDAKNTSSPTSEEVQFKEWRIETLADVAQVDDDQLDKLLYFIAHALRKCHIQNVKLVSLLYHERGKIILETDEKESPDPVEEEDDIDPFS